MISLTLDELAVDERELRRRHRFGTLLRPLGGVVSEAKGLPQEVCAPGFAAASTMIGDIGITWPELTRAGWKPGTPIGGAGADPDADVAWVRSVAEALERYAACVRMPEDTITATADELGGEALDLEALPRVSDRELVDPSCPIVRPDLGEPMRWVEGWSLRDDARRYVPLICTHLYVDAWPAERIWYPISTGTAAHTDLATALVNAVSESIERDAIAITWLARLPLARIELPDVLPPELEPNVGRLRRSQVRQLFFDATTDLGVPTVYSLQLTERHPRLGQYVNCATELDPLTAIAKTVREAAPARTVLQMPREVPEHVADFVELESGAIRLGRPEHRAAFNFLLDSPRRVSLDELERPAVPAGAWGRLAWLLDSLKPLGTDVVVVDLTPGELREAGLHVVKVVIPGLMPMSSMHRARFLGHPRLYQAARDLGHPIAEDDVNPDPQPFA